MADRKKPVVVEGIEFGAVFQFHRILGAVTAAMQPPRLVVALMMVVALAVFGRTWDAIAASGDAEAARSGAFAATRMRTTDAVNDTVQGVIELRPGLVYEAGADLFLGLPAQLWREQRWFALCFGLFFMAVLAIGGGALSRMAACQFACNERLRLRDGVDFALGHWLKLLAALLLPLLLAGVVAVLLIVFGLLLAPWIDVVGSVLYGAAVLLGFALAFLLFGYALGAPLLLPAVACENCDPADAQQRVYALLLGRPLHLLGYAIVALVGFALGYVVVAGVTATMLNWTAGLAGLITDHAALTDAGRFGLYDLAPAPPPDGGAWHQGWSAGVISFWQRMAVDLVAAYVVSYVFAAATMVYLLLRRACDGQDIEEIWQPGLIPGTLVPMPPSDQDRNEPPAPAAGEAPA